MAHYALIKNNIVEQVIVAEEDFIKSLEDSDEWLQTSYNTRGGIHYDPETNLPSGKEQLRKNFAGIGYYYNSELDAFIPPKPDGENYILNTNTCLWENNGLTAHN